MTVIKFECAIGPVEAYRAAPSEGTSPGVLVLHAWWGLTPVFKGVCDRLAAEGFVALAPEMYGGATADTREEAERLNEGLDYARTYQRIQAAVEHLRTDAVGSGVGVVGFSLGGGLALTLEDHIRAVVTYYEAGEPEHVTADAAYQGHFAEVDEFVSLEAVHRLEEGLRAKGREVECYVYEGTQHWFFEENRTGYYDAAAARLSWDRTIQFLHRHLTPA